MSLDDVQIPDLETTYSRFPNVDHSAINGRDFGISAIVTERQLQLDAVLHEISGLETIMDNVKNLHQQLVDKKEKIMQSMNLHKGLVSTLWRFPTEVLAQIFHYCLPEHVWEHEYHAWGRSYSLSSDPKRDAPMQLARVCRRWRDVVVDMPSLWCKLHLGSRRNSKQSAFCYDAWLKRSKGTPLSVTLLCYKNGETKLRSVIQPYISQISSLDVEFFDGANPGLLLKDIPALQELTIRSHNNDMPAVSQLSLRLPSTLHSFKLVGLDLTLKRLSSLGAIFAQLTKIEVAVHHPNALLRLLQLSPNLSSLTFSLGSGLLKRALEPFTHVKLHSLRITQAYASTLPNLLNALSLPNLRVLAVAHSLRAYPHEELKALLTRSNCPLESLTFDSGVTTDEQRAEYVALMPSLEIVVDHTYDDYLATMLDLS
ncbi:hypothetical protein DEU56DRAFT_910831 [Suillus clintonianus]|uniref:uncharacterized protein n=1 Tax=Suillus clintonianus TaxID=1904413 RepID=UPI001B879B86|nr:uncharacterized protein DEU56DRAFT_910831 [Suillus clintonianus]KAG2143700.1 hypothetical protein DEU56DRAFT_910831 [Suillus clintonianus]